MDVRDKIPRPKGGAIADPCASCDVRCCNRFAVPLTGFDIARILKAYPKLSPHEFAQLAPADGIEAAPHSSVFVFNEGRMEERLLTLKRRKNMYCVFSFHSLGCGIWGNHPMVCRTYPFVAAEGKGVKYTKNFVCPRKWKSDEFDETAMIRLVGQMDHEIAQYNKIVRKWNATKARGSQEEDFWAFLLSHSPI